MTDPDHLLIEEWRDCPSHSGYQASSSGRVRSVDRVLRLRNGRLQTQHGQMLRPILANKHLVVTVAGRRRHQAAALVLDAFVGPRPQGALACHRDDDGFNNVLINLYWGDKSSNALDTVRLGTHGKVRKKTCPLQHLLIEPNLVPWQAARGHRSCLACSRAHGRLSRQKKRGLEVDFKSEADRYYAELMQCEFCLHELHRHGVTGCAAVDDLGNRCACEYVP